MIHPIETIKKSWEDDLAKWNYDASNVSYVTTASLWKLATNPQVYDIIVMDEVQLFSPANLQEMKALIEFGNKRILGLSGTVSRKTADEIMDAIKLPVLAEYSIHQGVMEKVITDYEINIVLTDLDSTLKYIQPSKKLPDFKVTELDRYKYISNKIELIKQEVIARNEKMVKEAEKNGRMVDYEDFEEFNLGLLPLQRMHLIRKSVSKLKATKQ